MNKKDFMDYSNRLASTAKHNRPENDFYQYQNDRFAYLLEYVTDHYVKDFDLDGIRDFIIKICKMVAIDETAILRLQAVANDHTTSNDFIHLMALQDCLKTYISGVLGHGHNKALAKFKNHYRNGRDE